jgi:hypothetical protein
MATTIQQDGYPYLPDPDDKYSDLTQDSQIRDYLHALIKSILEQFSLQKTDADNLAAPGLSGTKVYYVSDSSGGAVTRKLTFTDGILTAET